MNFLILFLLSLYFYKKEKSSENEYKLNERISYTIILNIEWSCCTMALQYRSLGQENAFHLHTLNIL